MRERQQIDFSDVALGRQKPYRVSWLKIKPKVLIFPVIESVIQILSLVLLRKVICICTDKYGSTYD